MCTVLGFLQLKLGTADGNIVAVFNKVMYALAQRKQAWTSVDQGDAVD